MSSPLYFPNVTFNRNLFSTQTGSRITYNGNINLDPTDEQIVALLQNDVKMLSITAEEQQAQINYLKDRNDRLIQVIKNLTNITI